MNGAIRWKAFSKELATVGVGAPAGEYLQGTAESEPCVMVSRHHKESVAETVLFFETEADVYVTGDPDMT